MLKVVLPKPIDFNKVVDELKKPFSDTESLRGQANPKSRVATRTRRSFADRIRNNIENGNFEDLSDTTIFIRERGLSPNSGYSKTSSRKPLIHTGNLLRSIKETETGVSMASYGQYHLQEQTIARNGFTNWFYKRYSQDKKYPRGVKLEGSKVPKRDFIAGARRKSSGGGGAGAGQTENLEQQIREHLEKVVGKIAKSMFS